MVSFEGATIALTGTFISFWEILRATRAIPLHVHVPGIGGGLRSFDGRTLRNRGPTEKGSGPAGYGSGMAVGTGVVEVNH